MANRKVVIAIGPSQNGKSATCNTLSGEKLAQEGDGSGESTTTEPNVYEFVPAGADFEVVYIDVPGTFDTRQGISDRSLKSAIDSLIDTFGSSSISAIVLFQSLAESNILLNSTVQFAQSIFGPSVTDSAFVLATKADLLEAEEKEPIIEGIRDICRSFNMRCCEWTNKGSEAEKRTAIASFLSMVRTTRALDLGERTAMRNAIEEEARKLQEAETIVATVEYEEDEKYTEIEVETQSEPYLAPMYSSESETTAKAPEVQKLLPQDFTYYRNEKYPFQYYVQTILKDSEALPLGHLRHHYTVHGKDLRTETRYRKVPYLGPRPIENVKEYMRRQTVQKTWEKKVKVSHERARKVERQRQERVPRFGIEHYRKVAAKELLKQIWPAPQTQ